MATQQTGSHTISDGDAAASHIPADIFRAYDIRGIVGASLNRGNIRVIGQAIGRMMRAAGRQRVLFAADARLSSPQLAPALIEGLRDSGCDVVDLGIVPTPLLYFATHTSDCDSGLMLTASHNPADYNGIKIVLARHCLTPAQIQALYHDACAPQPPAAVRGQLEQPAAPVITQYIRHVCAKITLQRPLSIIIDAGNAVPGLVAPALFAALGCPCQALHCEPDGRFPNHHPDPTIADNLQDLIAALQASSSAELGIAFDGDGDRVVFVSRSGRILDTDRLLLLLLPAILPKYRNPAVIFDVKSSHLLGPAITALGGVPIMSRSGHSFMKQRMLESRAVIGAEFSAHIFIADRWFGYDDGLYVAARVLEMLAASGEDLDSLMDSLPASVCTPELRLTVAESEKFALMRRIEAAADLAGASLCRLDGIRADYSDGWGLVRASNTSPALLLRFEATQADALRRIMSDFHDLLAAVAPGLATQFKAAGVYWADFSASN